MRHKFYDFEWQPVITGKYTDTTDESLPPPEDPAALSALASSVSAALPAPFCRVDLYETTRGPVVGELTPEPGGYYLFDSAVDLYLGLAYELAEWSLSAVSASAVSAQPAEQPEP